MCQDNKNNNNSLFIIGLIFGALIASAILLTSTKDKAKIIDKIKNKFKDLFDDKVTPIIKKESKIINKEIKQDIKKIKKNISSKIIKPIQKISVDIPSDVESLNLTPVKTIKSKKIFKKSK